MAELIAGLIGIGVGLAAFALWDRWGFWKRASKGAPQYAQLEARPGAVVLDLVNKEGTHVLASLVLREIQWRGDGATTAEFIDKTYYLERNTYRE